MITHKEKRSTTRLKILIRRGSIVFARELVDGFTSDPPTARMIIGLFRPSRGRAVLGSGGTMGREKWLERL